jgi:hypothetical protein
VGVFVDLEMDDTDYSRRNVSAGSDLDRRWRDMRSPIRSRRGTLLTA